MEINKIPLINRNRSKSVKIKGLDSYWKNNSHYHFNIILKQYKIENIMNRQSKMQADLSDFEDSQLNQTIGYLHLDSKEIQELYVSYNKMKGFLEKVKSIKYEELAQILKKYSNTRFQFDLSPKNVMHMLDKRIQRMLKNKKIKKNWSNQDTKILCWTFSHYCILNGIKSVELTTEQNWESISQLIPGSSKDGCMFKILSLKKIKLAQQKWSQEQSFLLFQIAQSSKKKNWREICQQLYKRSNIKNRIFRNAKQCKQHWVCYLNPSLKKGSWSLQQDKRLMQHIYKHNGLRKWAQIAKIFGGRTQNALKNRYTLIIERLRRQKNECEDIQLIGQYLKKIQQMEEMQEQKKHKKQNKILVQDKCRIQKIEQKTKHIQGQQAEQRFQIQQLNNSRVSEQIQESIYPGLLLNQRLEMHQILPLSGQYLNSVSGISSQCQFQYLPIYQSYGQVFFVYSQ